MKGRTTLVLLICIVVLGTFIWVQESWRAKVPSREYRKVKLFDLDGDMLVSMRFTYTNSVVECVKENGIWMAGGAENGRGRADVAMVQRLIAGLNSMGKGTTITAEHLSMRGLDPAEYGFLNPVVEIRVDDNHGRHIWQVGRHTPLGDMVYVRQEGREEIHTVPDLLLELLPADAAVLRDRTVFTGEMAGVRRIEVRGDGGFVQLMKDVKTGWMLQQPVVATADATEVEKYLEELYRLRAEDFVADNVSDFSIYGLQGESHQISVGGADESSRMLVLGDEMTDRPGYVFARRADDTSVFVLKADVLDLLQVDAEDFRDASVLLMDPAEITSVSIVHEKQRLELVNDPAKGWLIRKPVVWQADVRRVEELLAGWVNSVVIDFDLVTADEPEWTFAFGSSGLQRTNMVEVLSSRGRKDGLLIRRDDKKHVCRINRTELPKAIIDPLFYKSRLVWTIEPHSIRRLSVEKDGAGREVLERLPNGSFIAAETTNSLLRVNDETVDQLVNKLATVVSREYVAYNPRDLSIYGLDRPGLTVQLSFSGTNQLGSILLVGRETVDGYFSMVKGRDVVFVLDKAFVEAASAGLFVGQESMPDIVE